MDLRQSPNYAQYMRSLGWIVENGVFIKKLWLTSIVKIQRPEKINLEILKKYHPFLIKIEPLKEINLPKFKKDNWPLLPSKTLLLELADYKPPKKVRYEIRKAQNLQVSISKNPEEFYRMLQKTMAIGHWQVPIKKNVINLWKSFQPDNSIILQTDHSGCLLVWHEDTAHYMYAALTKEGRKLGAAYTILWAAIKYCQSKKLKYLDLEGIYDERYPKSTKEWKGFTAFKKQWRGKVLEYPGSYTKIL